jgi:hypothetical protein
MGNLSTFLNEYGRHFDRLEEAYIWKIVAEVGDVRAIYLMQDCLLTSEHRAFNLSIRTDSFTLISSLRTSLFQTKEDCGSVTLVWPVPGRDR